MKQDKVVRIDPKKRQNKYKAIFCTYMTLVIIVTIIVCLNTFFHIEIINIAGLISYSENDIIQKMEVSIGDNIFMVNDKELNEMVVKEFPYIDNMNVVRLYPSTIEFVVSEIEAAYVVVADAFNYTLLSEDLKILEHKQGRSIEKLPLVIGLDLTRVPVGENLRDIYDNIKYDQDIDFDEKEWYRQAVAGMTSVETLHGATKNLDFSNISYYDVSDPLSVVVLYDDRVLIDLGSQLELAYKLKFAQTVIVEMGNQFTGVVNMQTAANNQRAYTTETDISSWLNMEYLDGYY